MMNQALLTTVFLDTDGTLDFGVLLLVRKDTGVQYCSQSGGVTVVRRLAQGFLVPAGTTREAAPLREFFRKRFRGNPPSSGQDWSTEQLQELDRLIQPLRVWSEGVDEARPGSLRLDVDNLEELTEAWIPVGSPLGAGVLVFQNSD